VRWIGLGTLAVALLLVCPYAFGQAQAPSDTLAINGDGATTWNDGQTSIIQVQGHVVITTDDATFSADNAVIWIGPKPNAVLDEQLAEISLVGNAKIVNGQATRTNEELYATEEIRGHITFFGERMTHDSSNTDVYKQAQALRPQAQLLPGVPGAVLQPPVITNTWLLEPPSTQPTTGPTSQPTTQPSPVYFEAHEGHQTIGIDGKVAYVLTGNVLITQDKINKKFQNVQANDLNEADVTDHVELRADRAVILTQLDSLRQLSDSSQFKLPEDIVQGAYLEGDVQITQTPAATTLQPENRLACQRVYYEFATERAVLTDAVIHTVEPKINIPIVVRAGVVHQLSLGEYKAQNAELTTSSFAVPSYSVRTSTAYIRQVPTLDPRYGNETQFVAKSSFINMFNVPVFWLPYMSGTMTDRGTALRNIEVGSSQNNGFGVRTEWGLFESLGLLPPDNDDAYFKLDYFKERNFGIGFNAKYQGGFISEESRQPWDFQGDFKSYWLPNDTGVDKLGKNRLRVSPDARNPAPDGSPPGTEGDKTFPLRDTNRGAFQYEHQHFFPDDWQLQFRFGLVTDPTFLPYWQNGDFNDTLPHDFEAYVKKQKDTEAFTLLVQFQPNDFPTTADQMQEVLPSPDPLQPQLGKPYDIERLPEVGYYRIGDSFADDSLTFFSQNTASVLHYKVGDATLEDFGFFPQKNKKENGQLVRDSHGNIVQVPAALPGFSETGQTGLTNKDVIRGDLRQEIDYPFQLDKWKASAYVVGRLTSYSDSPDSGSVNRLLGGAGVRMTTEFWKVDDSAQSDFFDIHRLRHVIEPELNLFTSIANQDRSDVFIYDQGVDNISDLSAAQLAVNQRWQTKRGGPGNWRSVDVFTLNVELNLFANKPAKGAFLPGDFRGAFFESAPEESIARDSINTDALWRISDTTVVLADVEHNLDDQKLATASVGMAVQRDQRMQYFLGVRYIGDINSTLASVLMNYQISPKYSLLTSYSFNFSENSTEDFSVMVMRHFDRFYISFEVFHDFVQDDSGIRFGIFPEGLGGSVDSSQLQNLFGGTQQ
jgi:lipopolysaccharide export system protein LptA